MNKRSGVAIAMACVMALGACASEAADPSLSPAEQKIRARNAQYNRTIAEGVGMGALVGVGIGALAGRNVTSMVIGGVAGGAAGAGLAFAVANRTQAQQQSEDDYHKSISQAQQVAQQATQDAQDARTIEQTANSDLQTLQARYNNKQITAEGYEQTIAHYKTDAAILSKQADVSRNRSLLMQNYAAGRHDDPDMKSAAALTMSGSQAMSDSARHILTQLSQVPATPAAPALQAGA